ncbi:MAG: Gfo/Idh/MocA family oxidoreductase [Bacteroidia bacterium]|nr:Gfo/Idh/MocA family oxidoreductase [Bacteroidia bacterium]
MKSCIKIAVLGYGYWGPNLVRNFRNLDNCKVECVIDNRKERLEIAKNLYPDIQISTDVYSVIQNQNIDAFVIATPVSTHFEFALNALKNKKHVLIEKPMVSSVKEAEILIEAAIANKSVLMIDHTYIYTGSVGKIHELINNNTLGTLKYFDSTRINLGLFQPDINVLWDLAPHDISILLHIFKEKPFSVNATGISHTGNGIENIAYMTLNYSSGFIAHFNCSWTSPVKLRFILIGGDKKMLLFNDLEPTEKIKIYDTGYTYNTDDERKKILVDYRAGDIYIPKVENNEALSNMAKDFINAIIKGKQPESDMYLGLEVVKILEAAGQSLKNRGKEINL